MCGDRKQRIGEAVALTRTCPIAIALPSDVSHALMHVLLANADTSRERRLTPHGLVGRAIYTNDRLGRDTHRRLQVENFSSTLSAADIRLRVGGSTAGLPRWMTAALLIPFIDAAVLLGELMTASCQVPRTQLLGAPNGCRCTSAGRQRVSAPRDHPDQGP